MDGDEVVSTVKLNMVGKLSYADDISVMQATRIVAYLEGAAALPGFAAGAEAVENEYSAQAGFEDGDSTRVRRMVSPRDALDSSRAATNPQKIVALASAEDGETFTLDSLRASFQKAREPIPKNIARDLSSAIRAGWAGESSQKGAYFLTARGRDTVESGFARRGKNEKQGGSAPRVRSANRKSKTAEVPDVFQSIDPIPVAIPEMSNYASLKDRKSRFLWALALAKALEIDGLTNQELVWLTDHLGAGIASNNVNSAFTTARKSGHANRSTISNKLRITSDGEAWLRDRAPEASS